MSAREVVLCNPVRTAIGTFAGALKDTPAPALGAAVIREALRRAALDPAKVRAGDGQRHPGRQQDEPGAPGGHRRRPSGEVPAMTVNRVCGSGAQAIATAAQEIWLGLYRRASRAAWRTWTWRPYLMTGGRWGYRMGAGQIFDSMLPDGLNDAFSGEHSGWHTEDLVDAARRSRRDDQDRLAARSQQRFSAAQAAGRFDDEIVPVEVQGRKGPVVFTRDEHNRAGHHGRIARQAEARLPQGRHDHRRQCARSQQRRGRDDRGRARLGRAERAAPSVRLVAYGIGAVEPGMFGLGPVPAVREALERAGWSVGDVERVEINEAFAAIALACLRELGFAGRHRQRGGRRHRPRPPDRRYRRGPDHPTAALDATRRAVARHRHPVHRRWPGHRARAGTAVIEAARVRLRPSPS